MNWLFEPHPRTLVEVEVTQRDQFRNDDVNLPAALIRENIQNAIDAANGSGAVRVRFSFRSMGNGLTRNYMEALFEGHDPHFRASGCKLQDVEFSDSRALVIEDFNTTGLTGLLDGTDNCNFSDFWWRHGLSHKGGKSGGRWGLGKLVYSSSSMLNSFFGLTVREGDSTPKVMGQTVLAYHTYQGNRFPAHTFFAKKVQPGNIAAPIDDNQFTDEFVTQFGLTRNLEPGLSIVIPFPSREITADAMIQAGIENYFYPILTGQLILDIDSIEVNASNIRRLATEYLDNKKLTAALYEFIQEFHEHEDQQLTVLNESWINNKKLDKSDFDPKDLERIRSEFAEGRLIGLMLPINLKPKTGGTLKTNFKVYLKRPQNLSEGKDLYVRGCLTVPNEAKFGTRKAFGAMVADDEAIASFLADAENPAHTKWTQTTEKLRRNYRAPEKIVRAIQQSVKQLYDLMVDMIEEEDTESLKRFFWTDIEQVAEARKQSKARPSSVKEEVDVYVATKPKPLRIEKVDGGFAIHPTKDLTSESLPICFKILVSYNVIKGNPFKAYVPWDFDFTGKAGPRPEIRATANVVSYAKDLVTPCCIAFIVKSNEFAIRVSGFDVNRDLIVKLETVELPQ